MSRTVTILFVDPGKAPEIKEAELNGMTGLATMYRLCQCELVETVHPFPRRPDIALIMDQEGSMDHSPNHNRVNRLVPEMGRPIYGPFIVTKEKGDHYVSLDASEAAWLMGRLGSTGDV